MNVASASVNQKMSQRCRLAPVVPQLLLVLGAFACAASTQAPKPVSAVAARPHTPAQPQLREPKWLPIEAREMLTTRMRRHGHDMLLLSASVLMLDRDVALELAERVAEEPRLGRPAAGEQGTLNALLPTRFFELDDELRRRSLAVAEATALQDEIGLAKAYGQLVETCVSCHVVYLRDDSDDDELLDDDLERAP
jgi:hypothetical protein